MAKTDINQKAFDHNGPPYDCLISLSVGFRSYALDELESLLPKALAAKY